MHFKARRIVFLFGLLVGCSQDRVQVHSHEAEVKPALSRDAVKNVPKGDQTNSQSLASLLKRVTDPQNLRQREMTGSGEFQRDLHSLNGLLLKKATQGLVAEELIAYENMLVAGCGVQLRGCVNLKFLRTSGLSFQLVKIIAKTKKDVREYYLMLKLAFEVKNLSYDHELYRMYLSRGGEYARALAGRAEDRQELLNHGKTLVTILSVFEQKASHEEMSSVLSHFQPWGYSRKEIQSSGVESSVLFATAAKSHLYKGKQLNPSLSAFIRESQEQEDSFTNKLMRLGARSKYLVSNENIRALPPKDEYFFMVERLIAGHLGLDEAAALWAASHKDRHKLYKFMSAALYIELLNTVARANADMRSFFDRAEELPTKTLLEQAFRKSTDLIPMFHSLFARIKVLRDFAGRTLLAEGDRELYRRLVEQIDALDNNIKFMVTYPHMLMLGYHLSKARFDINFRFFFMTVNIDSGRLLREMLAGNYHPWFGYSNNSKALNSIEMLYALYFAFQLDIFSDFKVDPVEFILLIMKQVLGGSAEIMRLQAEFVQEGLRGSTDYQQLRELCRQAQTGRIDQRLTLEDFLEKPLVGGRLYKAMYDPGGGMYVDRTTERFNVSRHKTGLNIFNNLTARAVEDMRTDLGPQLLQMKSLAYALETVLQQQGLDANAIRQRMQPVTDYLIWVRERRSAYVGALWDVQSETGHCRSRLSRLDRQRRLQIMNLEEVYLRSVHAAMKRLQSEPGLEEELNASLRTDTSILKVTSKERFNAREFHYHRLDFVARAVQYVTRGLSINGQTLDPIDARAQIDFPYDFRSSQAVHGAAPLRNPLAKIIEFDPDVEVFVTRALQAHFNSLEDIQRARNNSLYRWTNWFDSDSGFAFDFKYELRTLVSLYRMGVAGEDATTSTKIFSLQDVVRAVEDQLKQIQPLTGEQHYWQRFSFESIFRPLDMQDLFWHYASGEALPVFEHSMDLMVSELLGDRYRPASEAGYQLDSGYVSPSQISWFELGRKYAGSRRYRSTFIIPIDPTYDRLLDREFKEHINRDLEAPEKLIQAVNQLENQGAMAKRWSIPVSATQSVQTPLLSDTQVMDYRARVNEFHKVTADFFRGP